MLGVIRQVAKDTQHGGRFLFLEFLSDDFFRFSFPADCLVTGYDVIPELETLVDLQGTVVRAEGHQDLSQLALWGCVCAGVVVSKKYEGIQDFGSGGANWEYRGGGGLI